MRFKILFLLTAVLGVCLASILSHAPGKRGGALLRSLLPALVSVCLFALAACLAAGSADPAVILSRLFYNRITKLAGCALLLFVFCLTGFLFGVIRSGGLRPYFLGLKQSRPIHRFCQALPDAFRGDSLRFFIRRLKPKRLIRRFCQVLLGAFALLLVAVFAAVEWPRSGSVRLNEVCCENFSLRSDPDHGEYGDYIELYNAGRRFVFLGGCTLSDKAGNRTLYRLPPTLLKPGACLLLWADGTGSSGKKDGPELHLNFSLSPGETVSFSSPGGTLLDSVTVPERYKNVSLSRAEDDWVLALGTPGLVNTDLRLYTPAILDAPVLSLPSGFYDAPQTLRISAAPGCEIRYTLDGSVPSTESTLYTAPLALTDVSDQPNRVLNHPCTTPDRSGVIEEPVPKGTVIRASAFNGDACSEPATAVYFVGDFSSCEGSAVLSFVVDPEDLFGADGIAVTGPAYDAWLEAGGKGTAPTANYAMHGRAWERDAVVQIWDTSGKPLLDQACGVRV